VKDKANNKVPEVGQDFSGIARSVECYNNNGFRNFRIITLHIVNGKVMRQEYSDPYASFEAISRMELTNEMAIHSLNNTWQSGKTMFK
jgi:hypothetical protein